tara:strand:- start:52 stop:693 length:642 start_codon:yes stop_codon:yes gene_type:complete
VNVIIFGPPGAGKGTQAQNIAKKYNLYQISTGDLLRSEIKNKSEIGQEIEEIISRGDFATDDIVNRLIKKVVTDSKYKNQIIFDGYPRNINQAENLELILNSDNQKISCVLYLKVSKNIIEKRILGRVICDKCNKIFNVYDEQKKIDEHECEKKFLKKRKDDNLEAIITRFDEYMKKTKPVLEFYSSRSYFYEIDGSEKIDEISSKIEQILSV